LPGYRYAGLQSGTECYCGQSYGSLGESYFCDTDCPVGNEICGGYLSNSIYKTDYLGEKTFTIVLKDMPYQSFQLKIKC